MGKKKKFIDKKKATTYHVVHRPSGFGDDETVFSEENPVRESGTWSLETAEPRKQVDYNEYGLPNDGYDYSKHMLPLGEGHFVKADSRSKSENAKQKVDIGYVDLTTPVAEATPTFRLPPGVPRPPGFPDPNEEDKTMTHIAERNELDEDILKALDSDNEDVVVIETRKQPIRGKKKEETEEEEEEVVEEVIEFVKASGAESESDLEDDFMLLANEGMELDEDGHEIARGYDGSDIEFDSDDEEEEEEEEEEGESGKKRAADERTIDAEFDAMIEEYADDKLGETYPDEDSDLESEEEDDRMDMQGLEARLDEFQADLNDVKTFGKAQLHTLADDVEGRPDANRPHIRYVESDPYFHPSSRAVAAAERAGVKPAGSQTPQSLTFTALQEREKLIERATATGPEEYEALAVVRPQERWDVESFVTTYTNTEHHPHCLDAETGPVNPIQLSKRSQMPIGYGRDTLLKKEEQGSEDSSDEYEEVEIVNKGLARPKTEAKEEKKLRKQQAKQEKRVSRERKKNLKETYRQESAFQKAQKARSSHAVRPGVSVTSLS